MLGMKVYSSLLISAMALLGYRFFRTKMPAVIAFLAELSAIGMCWCPSVILYNYMTYAQSAIDQMLEKAMQLTLFDSEELPSKD